MTTTTNTYSSGSSWTVSRGSLDSVVTFESFDFPIDSTSTCRKPPLVLVPPSPSSDSTPCEINLSFTQKHEIRQVYVRSTARTYEIYYSPTLQSDNEYLCTVRCSAASVEEKSFPVNAEDPNDILLKARVAGENKIGTNEDDWVEVKLPVGPYQTSTNSRNYQDFYEATAEVNDSEPCMSLTIRLLSLQSKGCVYVDEVYVFADSIDSDHTESQTVNAETSAGSSLMTMLVPTLLGITKSRSVQLHDQSSSNPAGELIKPELAPTTSSNTINPVCQQDETLRKPSEAKAELTRSILPASTPDKDKAHDRTTNRADILLEQLVSRVSRIEDICMRFEENMLKPLNNMEARLQRVEQQVILLGKCPVSPSFSRPEPSPKALSDNGNDSQLCGEPELEKAVSYSSGTHKLPEDTSMVTPQEFPCCDEQVKQVEVNDIIESPKKVKPKKTISIDDALAAALAGFASFTKPLDNSSVESHEAECLIPNQASIDTTLESNTDGEKEASVSNKSLKETKPEFIEDEKDEATTYSNVTSEIPDNGFYSGEILQVDDDETIGPAASSSSPSSSLETDAQQDSIKTIKISSLEKTDILKYFPDQPHDESESRVDFESPILEVKFSSFKNASLNSSLETLLTYGDAASPASDEGVVVEEGIGTTNNLLVDLDGDDVSEDVQQDSVQIETSFTSLI